MRGRRAKTLTAFVLAALLSGCQSDVAQQFKNDLRQVPAAFRDIAVGTVELFTGGTIAGAAVVSVLPPSCARVPRGQESLAQLTSAATRPG